MAPTHIHEDIVAAVGEIAVSYNTVKCWCRDLKCGRTSCEIQLDDSRRITVTTYKNIKKVHDIARPMSMRILDIAEDTGLSYRMVHHVLAKN